jgi:hypothetical protein
MRIEATKSIELDKWIADRHYLKSTPAGARLRIWILGDSGNRIGAMMWGRPNARQLDQETEPHAESKALAMARKYIRKHLPQIKGLLAYSSTGQGHEGTIYQADNWFMLGKTSKRKIGWSNRENRDQKDGSQKIRWVRTP